MAYHFYLDGVLLPVTPGRLRLTVKSRNGTARLLDGTELNLLEGPGLTEAELEVLLPQRYRPFVNSGWHTPEYYLDLFERLKTEKRHCQFIVYRKGMDNRLYFGTNLTV